MNPKQELTDLTICRAVFALWVFTYHVDLYLNFSRFLGPAADLIRHGYLGVDGFFILSGLILARTHPELAGGGQRFYAKRRTPQFQPPAGGLVWRFYGKRLARIYPVHLASIIVLAVLVCVGRLRGWEPHDPSRFDVSSLLQNLTLLQGWGELPWSLELPVLVGQHRMGWLFGVSGSLVSACLFQRARRCASSGGRVCRNRAGIRPQWLQPQSDFRRWAVPVFSGVYNRHGDDAHSISMGRLQRSAPDLLLGRSHHRHNCGIYWCGSNGGFRALAHIVCFFDAGRRAMACYAWRPPRIELVGQTILRILYDVCDRRIVDMPIFPAQRLDAKELRFGFCNRYADNNSRTGLVLLCVGGNTVPAYGRSMVRSAQPRAARKTNLKLSPKGSKCDCLKA